MKTVKTGFAMGITLAVLYLLCLVWGAIFPNWPVKHTTIEVVFPYLVWTDINHLIASALRFFIAGFAGGTVYSIIYNLLGKNK